MTEGKVKCEGKKSLFKRLESNQNIYSAFFLISMLEWGRKQQQQLDDFVSILTLKVKFVTFGMRLNFICHCYVEGINKINFSCELTANPNQLFTGFRYFFIVFWPFNLLPYVNLVIWVILLSIWNYLLLLIPSVLHC